jgi:hypothetical protein
MIREDELPPIIVGQPALDQPQVNRFVSAVNFIADNGMTGVREVDANLVLAASEWLNREKREFAPTPREPFFNMQSRFSGSAIGAHAIFDRNGAALVLSEWCSDDHFFGSD